MAREYDITPNFTADLQHGQQGEQTIRNFLQDIIHSHIEVKTDRYRNGRIIIETDQNPRNTGWKKSGINITTAQWWIYQYHLDGAFIAIKTSRLKRYLRTHPHRYNNNTKQTFAPNSDNPAKGWILEQHETQDMMLNPQYDDPT